MPKWVFEKLSGAAVRRDPNETQLFKTEQAEEGEYAGTDALIREILQNSMDASSDEGPVRVRLALHTADELPPASRLQQYFGRLKSPLAARDIGYTSKGVPDLPDGFLVCEDFGTRGLGGDPLLSRDPKLGSKDRQDFFWFWRNIGRSGKTGDDLGRWGLGKTVYRAASQIGCMLGLTVRRDDGRQLLMGQAVLKIHEHDGDEYFPEGYWCGDLNADGLPLAIEDEAELHRFRQEWKLSRGANEAGLSVVVPFVAPELKGRSLLQAICVHFFLPIVRRELIVDLAAPDIREVHLDHDSIQDWCAGITWDGPKRTKRHVSPPIGFVKTCLAKPEAVRQTKLLGEKKVPELNADAFDKSTLEALRDQFAAEQLVGVNVRMALPKKSGGNDEGDLTVFLQRRPDGERTDSYYVREGMTITKLNSRAGLRGIHAFVNVDRFLFGTSESNALASLLGDSEGPAHEDWDTSEERPDRFWKTWKGRVKFCRRIVDNLVEVLAPPSNEADYDLLSDFFSVEELKSPQKARRPSDDGENGSGFPPLTSPPRPYRIEGRRGGFRIVSQPDVPLPESLQLRVTVAYDLAAGDPIKKWSPFDFDFAADTGPRMTGENVKAKKLSGNSLLLTLLSDKFTFSADGFDRLRDLYVRVDEFGGAATSEDKAE